MHPYSALLEKILADGKVDPQEIAEIRATVYADGKVDRPEADFLVELHKRLERPTPAFEDFFYQAIKDHVLADGSVDADEAGYLRRLILDDGEVSEREKKLLREIKGEAKTVSAEFEALAKECGAH